MVLEQVSSANSVSYLHGDQLGSIRLVTDAGGSIANSYEYDAYGARTETGPGTVASAFGYTGEYTDEESGLVYLRARYYDPGTQQFLSVDPIVGMTGQAYNYVGGSPLNGRDPSGLDENCSAWPNPFDEHSCIREGLQHPLGPWVVVGGVIVATGGIACAAGGCEAIGAALGIGGVAAESQAPAIANELSELAPVAEATFLEGDFCIAKWYQRTYPTSGGIELPKGPFRMINGQAYDVARTAAKSANQSIRYFAKKLDPMAVEGLDIHEIQPVKFGGSPTDLANKVALPESIHDEYTTWWGTLQRFVEGK